MSSFLEEYILPSIDASLMRGSYAEAGGQLPRTTSWNVGFAEISIPGRPLWTVRQKARPPRKMDTQKMFVCRNSRDRSPATTMTKSCCSFKKHRYAKSTDSADKISV